MHVVTSVFSSNSPHSDIKPSQNSLECRNGAEVTAALGLWGIFFKKTLTNNWHYNLRESGKGWWQIWFPSGSRTHCGSLRKANGCGCVLYVPYVLCLTPGCPWNKPLSSGSIRFPFSKLAMIFSDFASEVDQLVQDSGTSQFRNIGLMLDKVGYLEDISGSFQEQYPSTNGDLPAPGGHPFFKAQGITWGMASEQKVASHGWSFLGLETSWNHPVWGGSFEPLPYKLKCFGDQMVDNSYYAVTHLLESQPCAVETATYST